MNFGYRSDIHDHSGEQDQLLLRENSFANATSEDSTTSEDAPLRQSFLDEDQIKLLSSQLVKPLNFANSTKELVDQLAKETNQERNAQNQS